MTTYRVPGKKTIPEQIANDKTPYRRSLEATDKEDSAAKIDLPELEKLFGDLLAIELAFRPRESYARPFF